MNSLNELIRAIIGEKSVYGVSSMNSDGFFTCSLDVMIRDGKMKKKRRKPTCEYKCQIYKDQHLSSLVIIISIGRKRFVSSIHHLFSLFFTADFNVGRGHKTKGVNSSLEACDLPFLPSSLCLYSNLPSIDSLSLRSLFSSTNLQWCVFQSWFSQSPNHFIYCKINK